ncbi:hypothetical protein [Endozoicomonas sp. 8E]|uniref:hypothetical protein n=1 Tax=Endozoicomonas sp. 8E TaxID=3035692 RepID=UPI002938E3E9|nr:hypothetical protein [Endozoicomonas sp. 8E]WOG28484.1 hypothetical protein P6910_02175 [Endozoicomonas sp. 8E]
MKNTLSTALLLLLILFSVICQAAKLKRSFVVELEQGGDSSIRSFAIKPEQLILSGNPSYIADTHACRGPASPLGDKPHRIGGYGVETFLIGSASWQLIYAASLLVAYRLVLSTNDAALSGKPYSWLPEEALIAVGWLLKSYWNPHSSLFDPMDQMKASQDDPFVITTMMLPGQSQKQNGQQQSQASASSGQQASGSTTHVTGSHPPPRLPDLAAVTKALNNTNILWV